MDETRQRKDRHRRDRDGSRYKHASKDQDRPDRGRTYNHCPPSRNYAEDLKRYDRDRSRRRIRSRSASPVKGSEEYMTRKKLNTGILSNKKKATETRERLSPKRLLYTSEEIQQKIIEYVVKPNEGTRRNLINMTMELDNALNQIDNQRRLEISKILRRTAISMTSGDGNAPVVADIGVDLCRDVIDELSKILGINLEQLGLGTWLDPSEPFHPTLGPTFSATVYTTVPETSKLYDPHDPTIDDRQPEPHYTKINEPICDNKRIEKQFQSELPLVEIKDEPVDDVFVETFSPPAVKHEQTSDNDSDYDRMTVINDPDNHRESSPKLQYSVRLIECTIKTFVDIDKTESDPRYTSYNELIDKIEGLERCSTLLDDYKNYLLKNLFCNFRKLHKADQRYDNPQSPDNVEERPSRDLQSELRETNESAVSIRKRGCEDESTQEVKKMKLGVNDNQTGLGSWPNIEDRVSCLKCRQFTPKGITQDNLFVGTESGKVLILDLTTNQIVQTLDVCDGPVTTFDFHRHCLLYVGTATKLLHIYFRGVETRGQWLLLASQAMPDPVLCLRFAWSWVYIGCQKGTIVRFGRKERCIELESTSESGLDIASIKTMKEDSKRILIVIQRSGPIVIRDAESLLQLRIFSNQPEVMLSTVSAVAHGNGKLYCGTAQDDILEFQCNVENPQLQQRLKVPGSKGITCLQRWSNILVAGCTNGQIYFYSMLDKLKLLKVLEGPGGSVNCLAFLRNEIIISTMTCKLVRIDIPPEVLSTFNDTRGT